jgi:hypothetical protein
LIAAKKGAGLKQSVFDHGIGLDLDKDFRRNQAVDFDHAGRRANVFEEFPVCFADLLPWVPEKRISMCGIVCENGGTPTANTGWASRDINLRGRTKWLLHGECGALARSCVA